MYPEFFVPKLTRNVSLAMQHFVHQTALKFYIVESGSNFPLPSGAAVAVAARREARVHPSGRALPYSQKGKETSWNFKFPKKASKSSDDIAIHLSHAFCYLCKIWKKERARQRGIMGPAPLRGTCTRVITICHKSASQLFLFFPPHR